MTLNTARKIETAFDVVTIIILLPFAIVILAIMKEYGDQAIINGIRRMGLTKEKIAAAGYNPNIMNRGYFGTGGRKQ